jgi:Pin2-interacting protein X1
MSAQGWTPGNRLGAENAAHADFLTAASTSHIKVTIKDDNLGLGARAGRDPLGEPTGLDAFKGLLGRLNGKSEVELKQDQRKRDDVKLARYVAMKFPEVRFVRGGLLTQEKLEALPPKDETQKAETEDIDSSSSDSSTPACKSSKSKPKPKSKDKPKGKSKSKSKSSKNFRSEGEDAESSSVSDSKKKKKSKKRKADAAEDSEDEQQLESHPESSSSTAAKTAKASTVRERLPIGRQVFRGRHIAQKKRALLDDKSLNEVSYLKRTRRWITLTGNRFSWSRQRRRPLVCPGLHCICIETLHMGHGVWAQQFYKTFLI